MLSALVFAAAVRAEPSVALCEKALAAGMIGGPDGWVLDGRDARADLAPSEVAKREIKTLIQTITATGTVVVLPVFPPRALTAAAFLTSPAAGERPYDVALAERNYADLLVWLGTTGALVVDLLPVARSTLDPQFFYFRRDHHVTPAGTAAAAKVTAEAIRRRGIRLPSAEVRSEKVSEIVRKAEGRGVQLAAHCGGAPTVEPYPEWITTITPVATDLLADAPEPKVVLAGTSISGKEFNFVGFLSDELDADVMGVSTAAGGLLSSLQEYLRSINWHDHRPDVLVWEFAHSELFRVLTDGAPDPNNAMIYREIAPSVYADCGDAALRVGNVAGAPGAISLLDEGGTKVQAGDYLMVRSTNGRLEGFGVEIRYADRVVAHTFAPATRVSTYGRFFLALEPGDIVSVEATFTEDPRSLSTRICPGR